MPKLPPESTLRYLRALSLEAFCDALGWRVNAGEDQIEVPLPSDWTPAEVWDMCLQYDVPMKMNTESAYLSLERGYLREKGWGDWVHYGKYDLYLAKGWNK